MVITCDIFQALCVLILMMVACSSWKLKMGYCYCFILPSPRPQILLQKVCPRDQEFLEVLLHNLTRSSAEVSKAPPTLHTVPHPLLSCLPGCRFPWPHQIPLTPEFLLQKPLELCSV